MTPSRSLRAIRRIAVLVLAIVLGVPPSVRAASSYTLFESGQVRPLAMAGGHLFVTNTPDNRLEIFDVTGPAPVHVSSVAVGLEPVAVAARNAGEVWVVNHVSDSISIVDVSNAAAPRVVRTLLVGDEPRDVVFAGPGGDRAFITTAHRGQNTPLAPTIYTVLTTPGIGRADVWVFDAANLGTTLGGTPLTILTLFGDTPRALAVSPDGSTVYAAVFESGNRTTTISEGLVCNGGSGAAACGKVCLGGPNMHHDCTVDGDCPSSTCVVRSPGGLPAPNADHNGLLGPEVGLIVQFDGTHWVDELNRHWDNAVDFSLPDRDVFAIDATQNPPVETAAYTGVGTILFNMAVNPVSGRVYVTNTDAQNQVRFEGTGTFSALFKPPGEPASVRGHLAESRITVLDGPNVTPRHLNKHVDYGTCCAAAPNTESEASLAFPLGMAVSSDGLTLYVAGFGSSKIGVYTTADIENDTFTPGADDVTLNGLGACPGGSCGPTGIVLDEAHSQLYVATRFDDGLSVVSTATGAETAHVALHSPEPASVVNGRRFNYDARFTSSHGDSACASCHIFADFDSLAWDLGDPDGNLITNPGPFRVGPFGSPPAVYTDFHPMKGPMTTQSLRGLANHGAMHWRGDRTGGNDEPSAQPNKGTFNEDLAFKKFNVAFPGLLGRSAQLTPAEMQAYTDFILQVTYPPNPIRAFEGLPDPDVTAGNNFFNGPVSDTFQNCNGCHRLDPTANANTNVAKPGFFGTDGEQSFENETQHFKVPHLRNLYQKVGMFGMVSVPFFNAGDNGNKGNQVRGFGFLHDGSVDTLFRFHNSQVFNQNNPGGLPVSNPGGFANGSPGDPLRRQVEQFMFAFDSNLAPIVGQQVTLSDSNFMVAVPRIALLESRAAAGECELTVKGTLAGEARGWVQLAGGSFRSDRGSEPLLTDVQLRNLAFTPGQEQTYTCVPPGSGLRVGVDRDEDGWFDRDELDLGSDPADPGSVPAGTTTTTTPSSTTTTTTIPFVTIRAKLTLRDDNSAPINLKHRKITFRADTPHEASTHEFAVPGPGTIDDPRSAGATLIVYNSNPVPGSPTDLVTVALPAANWTLNPALFQYEYRDLTPGAKVTLAKARPDHVLVKGGGANWSYTLEEPAQGSVAVRFFIGDVNGVFRAFCADVPAKASGHPPVTTTHDLTDRFDGETKTPVIICPALK